MSSDEYLKAYERLVKLFTLRCLMTLTMHGEIGAPNRGVAVRRDDESFGRRKTREYFKWQTGQSRMQSIKLTEWTTRAVSKNIFSFPCNRLRTTHLSERKRRTYRHRDQCFNMFWEGGVEYGRSQILTSTYVSLLDVGKGHSRRAHAEVRAQNAQNERIERIPR
jgi:hypothetical protein